MSTATKTTITDKARGTLASQMVYIRSDKGGVVPLERRDENGNKIVSTCEYDQFGKMRSKASVRPLKFDARGVMALNPADPDDEKFIKEVTLWLEDGRDPRIARANIRMATGDAVEGAPIQRYEKYKPEALITRIAEEVELIGDSPEEVREFLEACARYEVLRVHPPDHASAGKSASRKKVLDAIDELGFMTGIEYGGDEVGEE